MTDPIVDNPFATPMPQPRKAKLPAAILSFAALCGVIALPLAIQGLRADAKINNEREQDRIESDLDACERGNKNREVQLALHTAQRDYVDGVLDGVTSYAQMSAAEKAVLNELLAPARDAITEAINSIEIIDCSAVVLGAENTPSP